MGEDDGRVPQIFISYALNYCCVFVIFSLFRPFFYRSSQTFSIKICSKYLYDATPNNTLWKMWCTDIESLFSCFECIIYYLIFLKQYHVSW